jgi:hypothetical protein
MRHPGRLQLRRQIAPYCGECTFIECEKARVCGKCSRKGVVGVWVIGQWVFDKKIREEFAEIGGKCG